MKSGNAPFFCAFPDRGLLFLRLPLPDAVQHIPDRQSAESRFFLCVSLPLWQMFVKSRVGQYHLPIVFGGSTAYQLYSLSKAFRRELLKNLQKMYK
ncbi:MAG: hypothetical protein J6R86_00745 [Lentisphaeria bacterium]|nr:hypothetical protein [Lentisphaeria bacterium]